MEIGSELFGLKSLAERGFESRLLRHYSLKQKHYEWIFRDYDEGHPGGELHKQRVCSLRHFGTFCAHSADELCRLGRMIF